MEKIEYKLVEDLIPYENNPRLNDDAVDKVAKSIQEFGFKVPIVVDENNIIVAGHTRLKASKQLGLERVPVLVARDLSEEQVRAFRLADNKTSEFARWDFDMLAQELEGLDMEEYGFDSLLPDIDIGDMFVEASSGIQEGDESKIYLKWERRQVEISENDVEILESMLASYAGGSFIQHMMGDSV